ncbi:MAG: PDZ domain-containing protein [Candidatus Acidiferrales bacterium]
MRTYLLAFLVLLVSFAPVSMAQEEKPLLLRQPTLSQTDIAFMYGDDLWKVSREGGDAIRLTAGPGIKRGPHFSPDGKWIAFTGEYDGKLNVYVISADGGTPRRVTFDAGPDVSVAWTPDGKNILFTSPRDSFANNTSALFTVPVGGGFPTKLPLPLGWEGSYRSDGKYIAYRPTPHPFGNWSHYRGGTSPRIWIANLADSSVVKLPHEDWNDFNPLWVGDSIYFLSDRNGPYALFVYDTQSKSESQVIENKGLPIKSADSGPGAIVYEQFGSLHLYDLSSHSEHPVQVRIAADLVEVRAHFEKVTKQINHSSISPTGVRALFEAHGEILTVPAEKGDIRDITNSSAVADRDPAWSPDGKWIAYFSDESGEYALHLRMQNGLGEVRKINLGNPPSFFYGPTWSPDSKKIAYTDKRLNLWYVDTEKGTPVKIDTDYYESQGLNPAWSPDNNWIVYTKILPNHFRAVFVYSLDSGKSTQISDGMSDAEFAVFDKNGKYIYFTASTNVGPTIGGLDMSTDGKQVTRNVYVMVLRKDLPSPLAPESDEEKSAAENKDADGSKDSSKEDRDQADRDKKKNEGKDKDKIKDTEKDKEPVKVSVDFENISQRILALPLPAKNYLALAPGKAGELFAVELPPAPDSEGPPNLVLSKFDLSKRKTDQLIAGIQDVSVSFNGEKYLYKQGEKWFITSAAQAAKPGEGELKIDAMEVWVDPRAEWQQMYNEIWRIERDFLYDPHFHGVNLQALSREYQPYLDRIATRDDLNYLFQQMLSEINVGHMFVGGGTIPEVQPLQVGLLGADYKIENDRYRFARVYNGENWNPQLHAPLTQPGVNVVAGEYLLAVDGRDARPSEDVYSYFQETAGKQTVVKVGPNADGSGSREITVVPLPDESALRNRAWMEDNLRKVDELSGGKLAYVYLPNTGAGGFRNFNRYFFAQINKQGAVIDERFNSGGQAADYIIQYMQRKIWNYWIAREGAITTTPLSGIYGPKVMITNEFSGSGGDALPWYFRHVGLGMLVGKRTWGGLVGIGGYPNLMDDGFVTAPRIAFFTAEGSWEVENHGVQPDLDIELDPAAWRQGRDTQLEKAIEVVMQDLTKNPPLQIQHPSYPDYSKFSTAH